jgi:hypothetical protein
MTGVRIAASLRHVRLRKRTVCNVIRAEVAASAPETGAKEMPQRNSSRRLVLRLVLFTLAGWLLWALGRDSDGRRGPAPDIATTATEGPMPTRERAKTSGFSKRRLATTLAFTTLLFGGAAFSGVAGELFVNPARGAEGCTAETTSDDAEPASETTEPGASPAPEASCDASSSAETPTVDGTSSEESPAAAPAPTTNEEGETGNTGTNTNADGSTGNQAQNQSGGGDQGGDDGSAADGSEGSVPDPILGDDGSDDASVGADQSDEPDAGPGSPAHAGDDQGSQGDSDVGLTSEEDAPADLEFDSDTGYGVVWLHRELGDPTPPSKRLAPAFARQLVRASRASHVEWPLVLGVLRAQGHKSSRPASFRQLRSLASQLHALRANADEWRAVLAFSGRTAFADRSVALANYNRAVRLRGLVRGLKAETPALEQRVLHDSRLSIYPGGRDDVAHHRINVRVLVLVLYMAEAHGSVAVSSLDSGHRLYSRPGVISAHKYGLAVDIAALGGESILGHQQVGSLTERAVRNILLLPVELRPKQVISLLGLGGPSFPLADHYDHIHVGY